MAWSDEVRANTNCHLDLAYGDDERQKLDIYLPDNGPEAPAPVAAFSSMADTG